MYPSVRALHRGLHPRREAFSGAPCRLEETLAVPGSPTSPPRTSPFHPESSLPGTCVQPLGSEQASSSARDVSAPGKPLPVWYVSACLPALSLSLSAKCILLETPLSQKCYLSPTRSPIRTGWHIALHSTEKCPRRANGFVRLRQPLLPPRL